MTKLTSQDFAPLSSKFSGYTLAASVRLLMTSEPNREKLIPLSAKCQLWFNSLHLYVRWNTLCISKNPEFFAPKNADVHILRTTFPLSADLFHGQPLIRIN